MKQVYLSESIQEAELVRVFLRQRGISSLLENEFSSNVALSATALPLIISVSEQDEPAAVQVIREYLARNNLRP
jgi:hypothetical protein